MKTDAIWKVYNPEYNSHLKKKKKTQLKKGKKCLLLYVCYCMFVSKLTLN